MAGNWIYRTRAPLTLHKSFHQRFWVSRKWRYFFYLLKTNQWLPLESIIDRSFVKVKHTTYILSHVWYGNSLTKVAAGVKCTIKQKNLENNSCQHLSFKSYLFTLSLILKNPWSSCDNIWHVTVMFTFLGGQRIFKAISSLM